MKQKNTNLSAVLVAAVSLASANAFAADPLANCEDGVPFAWGTGGAGIPFNPDQGPLGPLDNADAVAQVAASFAAWEAIPTATATYSNAGLLPVDVDVTNFGPYLEPAAPDGLSAIVFDDTGEIFELLFGPDTGVLGFAGPEWINFADCTITEGVSFLNGPSFGDIVAATDVMVHEFGHYSNLAHVQVNGALGVSAAETTGPSPDNTTFPFVFPDDLFGDIIETMYPFYFGPAVGTQTPEADDVSSLSDLYPAADYASSTMTITGSVRAPNGTTRISGVNIIARNLSDPLADAVSAISGGYTEAVDPATSDVVGTFAITGLTPGADYALFIDDLNVTQAAGGAFSTTGVPLPGPEEYWNGASESSDPAVDDPLALETISGAAGEVVADVNVIINEPQPGQPLNVGDDGAVQLFMDFPFDFCGIRHESIFVNANGHISFVAPNADFSETTPEFLSDAPRIAGLWDDFDPTSGGTVTFEKTAWSMKVIYDDIPEWGTDNSNSFSITLFRKGPGALAQGTRKGSAFKVSYGDVAALDGISGYSCGANGTSGFEDESKNLKKRWFYTNNNQQPGARFEQFTGNGDAAEDVNLSNRHILFAGANALRDTYEPNGPKNNTIADASWINLPFDSSKKVTSISPDGDDVDFFKFNAKAGEILAIEVVRTHNDNLNLGLDTVIGLFDRESGALLAADDDGGYLGGLGFAGLSRILVQVPFDAKLALGVTTFPDLGFTGAGGLGGRYVLSVRKYPAPDFVINMPDESSVEVPLPNGFNFHGTNWNSVFINSNGHLTFGAENALSFFPNVPEFLAGPPRIAPLWDDFDPDGAAGGGNPGLVLVNSDHNSTSVHYVSISQFFPTGPNYFSVDMQRNGKVQMDIAATSRELGAFGTTIVGMTEGGGASDPGSSDLSKRRNFSAGKTVYESFDFPGSITPSTFDLYFKTIRGFAPPPVSE